MRNRKYDIEKYLRGELSPAEMHALEKEALNDPFLAEALEGVEQAGADNFLYDLHKINRSVHDRMRRRPRKNDKVIRMWGWTSAVAATILLLAVSGFIVVNILRDQQNRERSMATPIEQPEAVADSASVKDEGDGPLALSEKKEETGEVQKPTSRSTQPTPDKTKTTPATEAPDRDDIAEQDATENAKAAETNSEEDSKDATIAANDDVSVQETQSVAEAERRSGLREETVAEKPNISQAQAPTRAADDTETSRKLRGRQAGVDVKREAPSSVAQAAPVETTLVKGKVTDENGGALPGVNVVVRGTPTGAVTDSEGKYEIEVPGQDATLVFNFIGFESRELPVNDQHELNVTLEADIMTLSEVVVTGYSSGQAGQTRAETSFRSAEPSVGKDSFKEYLAKGVQYPQEAIRNKTEGKVTIRFTVQPTGELTDFEVLKGIGSGCEEELIRAIRQGPAWKPGTAGDQPVKDKVRVRYKFELQ